MRSRWLTRLVSKIGRIPLVRTVAVAVFYTSTAVASAAPTAPTPQLHADIAARIAAVREAIGAKESGAIDEPPPARTTQWPNWPNWGNWNNWRNWNNWPNWVNWGNY